MTIISEDHEKRIKALEEKSDDLNFIELVKDAMVAMQKKIGVNGSEDPSSIDFQISNLTQRINNLVTEVRYLEQQLEAKTSALGNRECCGECT